MDNKIEFNELCRLCLAKNHVNIHIFEGEGCKEGIFLKISTCLPVNISFEDKLPKRICSNCFNKLNILYKFCNKSANSEKQLLEWFNQCGTENDSEISIDDIDTEMLQDDSEIEVKEEELSFLTKEDDTYDIKLEVDVEDNMLQDIPHQVNEISHEECSDTNEFNAVTNGTVAIIKNEDDEDGRPDTPNPLQTEINSRYTKIGSRLCIVPDCDGKNNDPAKIVFHHVPRNYETRQKWFKIINRPDLMRKPYRELLGRKVCGAHFTLDQYDYPELLQLNINALPSKKHDSISMPFVESKPPPIMTLLQPPQQTIARSLHRELKPLPMQKVIRTYPGKRKRD